MELANEVAKDPRVRLRRAEGKIHAVEMRG